MAEHKRFETLDKAMCRELETLDNKYAAGVELTDKDLERADKIMHYLKSAETYYAMVESKEYERGGMSEAGYRNPHTGRYMSRDYYPEDGYSGHFRPREYLDPYYDRRY